MENREKKQKYFGRYCHATGLFTAPDGKRYKCSWKEYLDWVGKNRGWEVARRIQLKYERRTKNEIGTIGGLTIAGSKEKN